MKYCEELQERSKKRNLRKGIHTVQESGTKDDGNRDGDGHSLGGVSNKLVLGSV